MTTAWPVTVILLAAGQSRRMRGKNKLHLKIGNTTVLRRSYDNAVTAQPEKIIVVVAETVVGELLSSAVNTKLVVCETAAKGMSESLKTGILAAGGDSEAVLVMLADQPCISTQTVQQYFRLFAEGKKLVAGHYKQFIGCPALFHRDYFDELLQLSGDRGARSVLESHRKELATVDIPEEEAFDIDVQEDIVKMEQTFK